MNSSDAADLVEKLSNAGPFAKPLGRGAESDFAESPLGAAGDDVQQRIIDELVFLRESLETLARIVRDGFEELKQ